MFRFRAVTIAGLFVLVAPGAQAQQSVEELAEAAVNPVADLMSFPFQNNTNGGFGEFDRIFNVLNIQPFIPLAGGKVVTRTIIPMPP